MQMELPDDIPDEVKKQIEAFMKKIITETGCNPDDLSAILISGKGAAAGFKGADSKKKTDGGLKILAQAKELGLESPKDVDDRVMAAALVLCLGMLFNIKLSTVADTNMIKIGGITMKVSGVEDAKKFKRLMTETQNKLKADPNGKACINAASKWILGMTGAKDANS